MYELQILRHGEFEGFADENRFSQLPISARRGAIFDRFDRRLAFNVPAFNVTIVPAELPADETAELEVFSRLSALGRCSANARNCRASRSIRSEH